MLSEDELWATAVELWNSFPSCQISSGFLQAYRIAKEVIDCNGCDSFLKSSKIHCGVRRDFTATATGLERTDGYSMPPPT